MSQLRAPAVRATVGPALLLAWVGGYVDAVGFLLLQRLFTSHETGNTVVLGVSVGTDDWSETLRRAFPISLFMIGVAVGTIVHRIQVRYGVRSPLAMPLALEAGLLGLFLVFGGLAEAAGTLGPERPSVFYPVAAFSALAMGLQNSTLRTPRGSAVRTTFVSGTLCSLAEEAVAYLSWFSHRQRHRGWQRFQVLLRLSPRQAHFNQMVLSSGLWLGFALGAIVGVAAKIHVGPVCLAAPVIALALLAVWDLLTSRAGSSDTGNTRA